MKTWKSNLEETKKRYIDWWNHKGIVVNMWEHFQEGVKPHAKVAAPKAPKDLNQKWFDPEWRANYLDWYVAHSCLKADMLPVANTQLGPGSLAAILGGVFEGGEDTIWIHPDPNYTDDLRFDENNPNWLLHKTLLKACKEKAKGHYYVGMPDLMEGLDVLAAIKGTDKVLLDTVMQPEVLERQMQQINDIYFKVFDELYDIIREGDEMAYCYFSAWAPGKMAKVQCDISTMINTDDYRRFVQPFIREQCQKIDYTLYHLDGVGALHHLPAILEVEELNAIQWTPGVGEPQGGSPKWYDLYKQILNAGKSIMACWVTLDELRPLLDNIGGNGVHLEMDFHSEKEVEQALRIVEEYQEHGPSAPAESNTIKVVPGKSDSDEASNAAQKGIKRTAKGHQTGADGASNASGSQSGAYASGSEKSEIDNEIEDIINKVETMFNTKNTPAEQKDALGRPSLNSLSAQRVLVIDGAMGTMIQQYNLQEEDFRGERFANHGCNLKGSNDLLCITRPEVIREIHRKYLEAGADMIETNTFNAQKISMSDYQLGDVCREINLEACRIAREVADEYTRNNPQKPRYVLGSVGPTSKTCSIASDTTQPGFSSFGYNTLLEAYAEQMEALIDGGVDAILIETIFDTLNAKAAVEAACSAMQKKGKRLPLMLSFTVTTAEGRNMLGQSVEEFVKSLGNAPIFSVGVNCAHDIRQLIPFIAGIGESLPYKISVYPNAGFPDKDGKYSMTPEKLQAEVWPLLDAHLLNIVGGCCGTTDAHIKKIAQLLQPAEGLWLSPHIPGQKAGTVVVQEAKAHESKAPAGSHPAATGKAEGGKTECECCKPAEKPAPASSQAAADIFDAIVQGKADKASEATQKAIDEGITPQDIINNQMIRAMAEVGQRFQDGKAFVPQLLMAGRAMKAALELLKPLMAGDKSTSAGTVVIGTVKGDLHDIGKNLVASMLEGSGFEVVNIGIDVSSESFVEAIKTNKADILCMSALLTTTMTYMKEVINAIENAGIRSEVKIMVGGAPISQSFADEIGADGYSDNANSAVAVAKKLVGK